MAKNLRPVKRSITLHGHRTSVSLEEPFWTAFRMIADSECKSVSKLAAEIDQDRGLDCGLAGAMRLYVLRWYQDHVA